MTELLQQASAQIQKLPPDQQDAIAARFLAESKDEQQWETRFAATTDDQWDQMAAMVRQEIARGETVPLDEVFPSHKGNRAKYEAILAKVPDIEPEEYDKIPTV